MDMTPPHPDPDDALLVAFANGDPAAGRALVDRLAPRLFAHAARVLGDRTEAEDVVQEALLRLWKRAPDWRPGEAKVSTWAFRVATNLTIDRLRARRPTRHLSDEPDLASDAPSADAQMIGTERSDALQAALDTLPERQKQAVVLRHLDGLTNPEIAEIMDLSIEAIESLTSRGKRRLKAALAGRKEDLGYER